MKKKRFLFREVLKKDSLILCGSLFSLLIFASCVGTVEETEVQESSSDGGAQVAINYPGILEARATSDKKIELIFPIHPGNQIDYRYLIFKDNEVTPREVSSSSLSFAAGGFYQYAYASPDIVENSTYSFSVEVYDSLTGLRSNSGITSLPVKTMGNQMCDFDGVSHVTLGVAGNAKNQLTVHWVSAVDSQDFLSPKDSDPYKYEVRLAEASPENLESADTSDEQIVDKDRTSYTFNNLTPDTRYYARVRCIHRGWDNEGLTPLLPAAVVENASLGTYRRETNNKFIIIQTEKPGNPAEWSTAFSLTGAKKTNASDTSVLNKLKVSWELGSGEIDHYRVVYKRISDADSFFDGTGAENEGTVKPGFDAIVGDLLPGDFVIDLNTAYNDDTVNITDYCATDSDCGILSTRDLGTEKSPAGFDTIEIDGLDPYAFYQVKVLACPIETCDGTEESELILSEYKFRQVLPPLVQFDGITSIENPRTVADQDKIEIHFDTPLLSTGYVDDFHIYCHDGPTDTTPTRFTFSDEDSSTTSNVNAGTGNCAGLTVNRRSFRKAQSWDESSVQIIGITANDNNQYCFSIISHIDQTSNSGGAIDRKHFVNVVEDDDNETNPTVYCIVPTISPPTNKEFTGFKIADNDCSFDYEKHSLRLQWKLPTSGLFQNFKVFVKEYDPTETEDLELKSYFNWKNALDGNTYYGEIGGIAPDMTALTMGDTSLTDPTTPGLKTFPATIKFTPGKRFLFGVLSYYYDAILGKDIYSEANTAIRECVVPELKAEFNEWTNIVAIGPKVDGREPQKFIQGLGEYPNGAFITRRIPEYLNEHGQPMEVDYDDDESTPVPPTAHPAKLLRTEVDDDGTEKFNGVYGSYIKRDGTLINSNYHRWSNTGIIQIQFKEVKFIDDLKILKDDPLATGTAKNYGKSLLERASDLGLTDPYTQDKHERTTGYKIYRSDDNRSTWKELTSPDFKYQQGDSDGDPGNGGLILPEKVPRNYYLSNGRLDVSENRVTFTDYSVQSFFSENGAIDQARVYWYRVVPVFNGRPVSFQNTSRDENEIRVVLPPANMSFVSRMMVNRMICQELGKDILKDQYYSCPYSGIGGRSLSPPWTPETSVYDLGGDLLVDRFELGCNLTRGHEQRASDQSRSSRDPDTIREDLPGAVDDGVNMGKLYYHKGGTEKEEESDIQVGCFSPEQAQGAGTVTDDEEGVFLHNQVRPGDCYSSAERTDHETMSIAAYRAADCDNRAKNNDSKHTHHRHEYFFPGLFQEKSPVNTTASNPYCYRAYTQSTFNRFPSADWSYGTHELHNVNSDSGNHNKPFQVANTYDNSGDNNFHDDDNYPPGAAQSEFGAVFYMRYMHNRTSNPTYATGNNRTMLLNRFFSSTDPSRFSNLAGNAYDTNGDNRGDDETRALFLKSSKNTPTSCFINLSGIRSTVFDSNKGDGTVDYAGSIENPSHAEIKNMEGTHRPRWIGLTQVLDSDWTISKDKRHETSITPTDIVVKDLGSDFLYKKTVLDVLQSEDLYGGLWDAPDLRTESGSTPNRKIASMELDTDLEKTDTGRLHPDMPLTRVMTSNNSKLPPIDGLSQKQFHKLCQTYNINVGFRNDTESFVAIDVKARNQGVGIKKRLPRRKEFVAFAAWPETFDKAKILSVEGASDDEDGACNNDTRWTGGLAPSLFRTIGAELLGNFPRAETSGNDHPLWSGSGLDDSDSPNVYTTHNCKSRFGIQDAIGNYEEVGTDNFWCNPQSVQWRLGRGVIDGDSFFNALDTWPGGDFPPYAITNAKTGLELKLAPELGAFPGDCSVTSYSAQRSADIFQPFPTPSSAFESIYGDFFRTNYDFDGTASSAAVIQRAKLLTKPQTGATTYTQDDFYDQESVLMLRDTSNGRFLEFGNNSQVIPPLISNMDDPTKKEHSLALFEETINGEHFNPHDKSTYFSPTLGLPLACNGSACDATSGDHKLITTDDLRKNLIDKTIGGADDSKGKCEDPDGDPMTEDALATSDCAYFTGRSLIKSFGVDDYEDGYTSANYGANNPNYDMTEFFARGNILAYIEDVEDQSAGDDYVADYNLAASGCSTDAANLDNYCDHADGSGETRKQGNFIIRRITSLGQFMHANGAYGDLQLRTRRPVNKSNSQTGYFFNGGNFSDEYTGRYSLNLSMQSLIEKEFTLSGRCSVMVYGEDF